jgi:hypothetical protein
MFEDKVPTGTAIFKFLSMGEAPNEFILRRANCRRSEKVEHLFIGATKLHLKAAVVCCLGACNSTYKLHTNSS